MKQDVRFHLIAAIWGQAYVDTFLNLALPNQLSPRNIPGMQTRDRSEYRIFTTCEDAERIRAAPAFKKLASLMRTELVELPGVDFTRNKYDLKTECYQRGVEIAERGNAATMFIPPDAIWSDGVFTEAEQKALDGYRLYAIYGPSVIKEDVVPLLQERHWRADEQCITISAQDLSAAILQHLHPIMFNHFWHSPTFTSFPAHFWWRVRDEGVIIRAFHLHPFMMNPLVKGVKMPGSEDGKYVSLLFPDSSAIYVVTDSCEAFVCEMSDGSRRNEPALPNKPDIRKILDWCKVHAGAANYHYLRHTIRVHSKPLSDVWKAVEASADRLLNPVFALEKQATNLETKSEPTAYTAKSIYKKLREKGPFSFIKSAVRSGLQRMLKRLTPPSELVPELEELRSRVRLLESLSVSRGELPTWDHAPANSTESNSTADTSTFDEYYHAHGPALARVFDYLHGTQLSGCVLEFGLGHIHAIRCLAEIMAQRQYEANVCLFGSPALGSDRESTSVGSTLVQDDSTILLQAIEHYLRPDMIQIVTDSLNPSSLHLELTQKAALIHVKGDLASSARSSIIGIVKNDLLQDGCVLMFDDFNCHRANDRLGQRSMLRQLLDGQDRWICSPWFSYGWKGQAFFVHDRQQDDIGQP